MNPILYAARPATRLGPHLWLAAACIVVVAAVIAVTVLATRRRARRAAEVMPELPGPPRPFPIPLVEPMEGVALGTTAPGGWRDCAVRGVLGSRSSGQLSITCVGVDVAGLWLAKATLRGVRIDERFATKFMPGTGLLVISWEAAGIHYESGFRGAASRYGEVVAAVRGLLASDQTDAITPVTPVTPVAPIRGAA